MQDLEEIRSTLKDILLEHKAVLRVTKDTDTAFEVTGTKETMQGKKKVDGIYFASIVPKPKDVRFYFFPAYTHKEQIGDLPENLQKMLKGKSCFHIKKLDADAAKELKKLVAKSVKLYKKDGWL